MCNKLQACKLEQLTSEACTLGQVAWQAWQYLTTLTCAVGKASPTEGTLPGSIYFIAKYKKLIPALQANAMVGGDSASRAVAIGMVLGRFVADWSFNPSAHPRRLMAWLHCSLTLYGDTMRLEFHCMVTVTGSSELTMVVCAGASEGMEGIPEQWRGLKQWDQYEAWLDDVIARYPLEQPHAEL